MNILLLHGYSHLNAGDGLLVREAVALAREAYGSSVDFRLIASQPETFANYGIELINSRPTRRGYDKKFLAALRNIDAPDLVLGVGGGYLRASSPREAATASLVHFPQLRAAARRNGPTVYLPQSIGPLRYGSRRPVARALGQIDDVFVRDDRSLIEFASSGVRRLPDMALLTTDFSSPTVERVDPVPVLTVRNVRGALPIEVRKLADRLGTFDGYVQSATSNNDDRGAMRVLNPREILTNQALTAPQRSRVVVAVRLHAALMALNAGHFVIHLAYERKGFGAYKDLGLGHYCHNVLNFEAAHVEAQVVDLLADENAREMYSRAVSEWRAKAEVARADLVEHLREVDSR